jgi:Protein of unknown function (DUF664)
LGWAVRGQPRSSAGGLTRLRIDYEAECERSRRAIAGQELDTVAKSEGMEFTLRYALAHMIEETARHCGHLDLLRESIDGVRGSNRSRRTAEG